jgi:hypothetical protein
VSKSSKIPDVLKKARECMENGRYLDTAHALLRKQQRRISLTDISHVIKHGYHEKRKDQYRPEFMDWDYAIRGLTVDVRDIRIVVAFDEDGMLIITVIEIFKDQGKYGN